jgi:hypothetical protein
VINQLRVLSPADRRAIMQLAERFAANGREVHEQQP